MRLAGTTVVLLGRLATIRRRSAGALLAERGARLVRAMTRGTGLIVVGRRGLNAAGLERLSQAIALADRRRVPVVGEATLLSLLGLSPTRPGPADEARRLAGRGVSPEFARLLALLDLIDPHQELAARQSLKEMARALGEKVEPFTLVAALLLEPERLRATLPALTLARDDAGGLARRVAGRLSELDGQLRLEFEAPAGPTTGALFEDAERAEAAGAWAEAERLYRRCLEREPHDATLSFNLGNVLREEGRPLEAAAAFARAAALDSAMAEAWFNLAGLAEQRRRWNEARAHYQRALAIDCDYADAIFNLARLETERDRPAEALPLWQRYCAIDREGVWAERARKAERLCRQMLLAR